MNKNTIGIYRKDKTDLSEISQIEKYCFKFSQIFNPHKKLKFIHVAGTNGKGSVRSKMQKLIQEQCCYTPPNLFWFRERIKVFILNLDK